MADEGQGSDDKTETATPKHEDEARNSGQVALSHEAVTLASFATVITVLGYYSAGIFHTAVNDLGILLARAGNKSVFDAVTPQKIFVIWWRAAFPFLVASGVGGAAAVLLQTRFLLSPTNLTPKISRVNPMAGLKRMFGSAGLVELTKSVAKLCILAGTAWVALRNDWEDLVRLPSQDPRYVFSAAVVPIAHLFAAGICGQGLVAAVDLAWVRFRHAQDLRMSKQDIRDEAKDAEGNPHIKARIRRIQLMRSRRRMMTKIPTATVVVTNPTHYAVALSYDRSTASAPRIVAKGMDAVATRIREIAQAHNVPLVAKPPLARALYKLEVDSDIPAEHYKAVAEIIAFVWRQRGSGQAVS